MILELTGLQKDYPHPSGTVQVLRGIDFQVEKGETVAIIGPSGSGKSTLLSLLAGLDKPSAGSVALDGSDLNAMSESDLTRYRASRVGIVFQQFHLMNHLTAEENVSLPLHILQVTDARTRASQALAAVGLGARARHFPHELSGGECQRVAIARAMVGQPSLLLADEPSGNLDSATGDQVMQLLFDLVSERQMTLILVTHNKSLAERCQRCLSLREGVLQDG